MRRVSDWLGWGRDCAPGTVIVRRCAFLAHWTPNACVRDGARFRAKCVLDSGEAASGWNGVRIRLIARRRRDRLRRLRVRL